MRLLHNGYFSQLASSDPLLESSCTSSTLRFCATTRVSAFFLALRRKCLAKNSSLCSNLFMRVLCILFASLFFLQGDAFCQQASSGKALAERKRELRELCKKALELEQKISKEEEALDSISHDERITAPVVKNKYEILARCLTLLYDIQRASKILAVNPKDNKNDFVRCSIIIKNFASYFKSIGRQLGKAGSEMAALKREKNAKKKELQEVIDEYEKLVETIDGKASEIAKDRPENVIQNDVVYHIASKSESIEELDAELEAENAIGVLKNTKVSTELSLGYPASGKIITEFGDKNPEGEMIHYISFETRPGGIVISPANGCVEFAGKFLGYGNMAIISNGDYRVFVYEMDTVVASIGDSVEIGDYMGKMSTCSPSSPVLRIELKKTGQPLDPRQWMSKTLEKGKK